MFRLIFQDPTSELAVGPGCFNPAKSSLAVLRPHDIYNWALMSLLGLPLRRSAEVTCEDFKMM